MRAQAQAGGGSEGRTRYEEVNQIASSPLVYKSSAILDCAVVMPDMFDAMQFINLLIVGCEVDACLGGI